MPIPLQTIVTGFVVSVIGFFSTFAIVIQGLKNMGATDAQAASGLMAVAVFKGFTAIGLAAWFKKPISIAWSTPGLAFLAVATPVEDGFSGAIAAFIMVAIATLIAGLWRPIGRFAEAIPAPLAQAMLAGVLFSLCVVPFQAIGPAPLVAIPIILVWFIVSRFNRVLAVPAAVCVVLALVLLSPQQPLAFGQSWISSLTWVNPSFSLAAFTSLAVPFFIITMATQNVPGIAVLRSYGYQQAAGPLFTTVGLVNLLTAPFANAGGSLAAITAAMCANNDSHPDPNKRYWSAIVAGFFYGLFGLFAGLITLLAASAPQYAIATLAGVALFGVFANAIQTAWQDTSYREASAVTFLVTTSGLSLFGLGAAVCGLIAGGLVVGFQRVQKAA